MIPVSWWGDEVFKWCDIHWLSISKSGAGNHCFLGQNVGAALFLNSVNVGSGRQTLAFLTLSLNRSYKKEISRGVYTGQWFKKFLICRRFPRFWAATSQYLG